MSRVCSAHAYTFITNIRRICQRDRLIRFEVDENHPEPELIHRHLVLARKRFSWIAKLKEYTPHKLRLIKRSLDFDSSPIPLNLCTWNINGILKKREDLADYMFVNEIDIMMITETRRKADHWRLSFEGYNVVEYTASKGAGCRGIAMAVRKDITSFPVGPKSPYFMFLRVFGKTVSRPFIVGVVYLGHKHANKPTGPGLLAPHKESRIEYVKALAQLRRDYPSDMIVTAGDYNRDKKEMDSLLKQAPGFYRKTLTGVQETQRGGRGIDHFVISTKDKVFLREAWVDETQGGSDHWPVRATLHYQIKTQEEGPRATLKWKIPPRANLPVKSVIIQSNRFNALKDLLDDDILDPKDATLSRAEIEAKLSSRVRAFIRVVNAIGSEQGWLSRPRKSNSTHPTTNEHRKACMKRRELYVEYRYIKKNGTEEEKEAAFEVYKVYRKLSAKAAASAKKERWAKATVQADQDRRHNPKQFWAWVQTSSGWKRRNISCTLQPMTDKNGILQTESAEIREVWQDHYQGLAADKTGHSQDAAHWERVLPTPPGPPKVRGQDLEDLNEAILEEDVIEILDLLKKHKAPGPSAIPVELFKLLVPKTPGQKLLPNPGLKVLTILLNLLWSTSFVPDDMNISALVSILKKGDPTLPGNYRGISLIESLSKILITLISRRLTRILERVGIFIKGQCGFRLREEAVAQALALHETIKRRMNVGLSTYALFLDYQKAFDTVPHEGLFRKLQNLGITGKMLNFIKALYANSTVQVRSNDGSYATSFRLLRGVRQGCPLSSILFDIYINDMLDDCDQGVPVPASRDSRSGQVKFLPDRIPGLLYADDAAILAAKRKNLLDTLTKVQKWSEIMELTFGVDKCGLICFNPSAAFSDIPCQADPDNPGPYDDPQAAQDAIFQDKTLWQIDGIPIPVVTWYTYLGLDFHYNLSMTLMAVSRLNQGRKGLYSLEAFLKCPSLPVTAKLTLLKGVFLQTMLYGSEIWGMKRAIEDKQTVLINIALRWILNFKGPASLLTVGAMYSELGLLSVSAQAASRRTRAYIKFPTLKTWIQVLLTKPLRLREKNWLTTTEQWLNNRRNGIMAKVGASNKLPRGEVPVFCQDILSAVAITKEVINRRSQNLWIKTSKQYDDYSAAEYVSLLKYRFWCPSYGKGFLLIMLFRANGYWVQQRLDDCHPERRRRYCPYCNEQVEESVSHLILNCNAWGALREKFLSGVIKRAKMVMPDDETVPVSQETRDRWLSTVILGGKITVNDEPLFLLDWAGPIGRIRATAMASFDQEETESPLWKTRDSFQVAGFLAGVDSSRWKVVYGGGLLQPELSPYGLGPDGYG